MTLRAPLGARLPASARRSAFHALVLLLAAAPVPPTLAAQSATGSLPAPRGLWVAQNSPRGLTIVWNGVPGAKGFRLFQVSGSGPERLLGNLAPNVGSFVVIVRNEMLSVPQRFSIETIDAAGKPSPRAAFNVVTPIDPGPAHGPVPGPASVRLAEGQGGIVVTWDAVPGATGYLLGRSIAPNGLGTLCRLCSTSTTYVDSAIVAGKRHLYTVSAITPHGAGKRTVSDTLTPTGGGGVVLSDGGTGGTGGTSGVGDSSGTGGTGGGGGTGTVAPPAAPRYLSATGGGALAILVLWESVVGATSYELRRSVCGGPLTLVHTSTEQSDTPSQLFFDDDVSNFTALGCPAGTTTVTVAYALTAKNAGGSSPVVKSAPLSLAVPSSLVPPTGLGARLALPTLVTLTWTPAAGATGYQIWRKLCSADVKPAIAVQSGTATTWQDQLQSSAISQSCTAANSDVVYTIASHDASGNSATATFPMLHLDLNAIALLGALPPPTGLTISGGTTLGQSGSVLNSLKWQPVTGAAYYQVTRSVCNYGKTQVAINASSLLSASDAVDWYYVNSFCPLGTTTASVQYWVATISSGSVTGAAASFPTVQLKLSTPTYGREPPAPVSSAQALYTGSTNTLVISWAASPAATHYRIERSLSGGTYMPLIMVTAPTLSYSDAPTVIKQNPQYRVYADNPNGESAPVVATVVRQ